MTYRNICRARGAATIRACALIGPCVAQMLSPQDLPRVYRELIEINTLHTAEAMAARLAGILP